MSLLWPNQLLVALASDNVAVINRVRGFSKGVVNHHHAVCKPHPEEPLWLASTRQFEQFLTATQVRPNTHLNIVLANNFVRYLALPPQQVPMNAAEKSAYATAAYREVYGIAANDWHIQLHDAPPHQTTIVAAVDKKLLSMLSQITQNKQIKLNGIQPYLMTVFNGLAEQLKKVNGYLAIVESGRLLLVQLKQGQCENLRTYVTTDDWQAELKRLMMRELLLNGFSNDGVVKDLLIYAPVHVNDVINEIKGWRVKRINISKKVLNVSKINVNHFAMLEASV
ncbi:MAG TPA: hypothetical protein VES38_00485 [Methylotenera sp.]|nr:hypothetical protein [Methylotenera sp.]